MEYLITMEKVKLKYASLDTYGDVIKELGKGTFGKVLLYKKDDKQYAVKQTLFSDASGHISQDLLTELSTYTTIDHPNIIKLVDATFKSKTSPIIEAYTILDFAEYGTLGDAFHKNKKCTNALSLIYQLLCGVSYLHSNNILHRDLKPQNVLVKDGCLVKIGDVGLSNALSCSHKIPQTYNIGTLWYRAPELAFGGLYTAAADMWSVGCIIFEMITDKFFSRVDSDESLIEIISFRIGALDTGSWPSVEALPKYVDLHPWSYNFPPPSPGNIRLDQQTEISIPLITNLMVWNPSERDSVYELLQDTVFDSVRNESLEILPKPKGCLDNLNSRKIMLDPAKPYPGGITEDKVRLVKDELFDLHRDQKINPYVYAYFSQLFDIVLDKLDIKDENVFQTG